MKMQSAYMQKTIAVEVWFRVDNPLSYFNLSDYQLKATIESLTPGLEVIEAKVKSNG